MINTHMKITFSTTATGNYILKVPIPSYSCADACPCDSLTSPYPTLGTFTPAKTST